MANPTIRGRATIGAIVLALFCVFAAVFAADNLAVTPGAGASLKTDEGGVTGAHVQILKLAESSDGGEDLIPADSTYGLGVDIKRSVTLTVTGAGGTFPVTDSGGTLTVDDGASSLTVDAANTAPVAVRLSNGSGWLSALPVTDNATTLSIDDGGGAISIDDNSSTISIDDGAGEITVDQGTAAASAGAWPMIISDGSNDADLTNVGADYALQVDIVQTVDPGGQQDETAFTEGTTKARVVAGVYNDSISSDPSEDEAAAVRITAKRGLHANLRNAAGTEIGTTTTPVEVRTRPAGTRVTKHVAYTASQTGTTVWDPTAATSFVITDIFVTADVGGAGEITLFDETDAAASTLYQGEIANSAQFRHSFIHPWKSAAADNILKYTTLSGATGEIIIHGYEE